MADTTRDFNLTRNEIISSALRKVGGLNPGETVSANELSTAQEALNVIVKEMQSRKVHLWTIQNQDIIITAGNKTYALDQDVIGLDGATYLDGTDDIPLRIISWREYTAITDKGSTASNTPTLLAMKTEVASPTLYMYPELTEDVTITLQVIQRLKDMDTASDTPDIPPHWIRYLIYALATDLAPEYSLDLRERRALEAMADKLFRDARIGDVEYRSSQTVVSAFPGRK